MKYRCIKCKKELPEDAFYTCKSKSKESLGELRPRGICKICSNAAASTWSKNNRERINTRVRKRNAKISAKKRANARRRAKTQQRIQATKGAKILAMKTMLWGKQT